MKNIEYYKIFDPLITLDREGLDATAKRLKSLYNDALKDEHETFAEYQRNIRSASKKRTYYEAKQRLSGITDTLRVLGIECAPNCLSDYLDNTIVEITTNEDGSRDVHFFGFGYSNDCDEKNPCIFEEYTGFFASLDDVLKIGFEAYEQNHQEQYTHYVENCTEEECQSIYEHYDNGNMPKLVFEDAVDKNIADGMYILIRNQLKN